MPIAQKNVSKYAQFHVDHDLSNRLAKEHDMTMAPFDGGVRMWANSIEELMAVYQDPEYIENVIPDEEKFAKRDEYQMMVGWEEVHWCDGKMQHHREQK
ncbi:hypothetical protein ANO11243_092280 [Dothideomycetidae sp. 11243]|nr:hypothetical protein ANO11243_092280 [fungal sp. No.11243]